MNQFAPEQKSGMRERIVNGHIGRTVWWLAWPSIFAMLLVNAGGLIDVGFVGRLIGADALSGVGLASQIMLILMNISTGIGIGSTALVARFVGARDYTDADQAVRQSILIAVIASAIFGIAAYLLGPTILGLTGARGEDLRQGILYLNTLLITITPFFLMMVLTGIYRGVGDVRTPLLVMFVLTAIVFLGDWLLIPGIGPIPGMGVVGAGMATGVARLVATIMLFAYLPRTRINVRLTDSWRPHWGWFARILNIGTPAALQGVLRVSALMAFYGVLRRTPDSVFGTAALTIGLRIEGLAYMPGFAFNVAATSMVGQNLGAEQPARAEQSAWSATWQAVGVTSIMGLVFLLLAYPISMPFTSDPRVLTLAARYLQINAISEPFLALSMVLTGALQGAGETRLPTWATIVTQWIVRLPLTYYLAVTLGYGAIGAWIAMSGTTVLGGLVTLAIFKLSRWQETQI